MLNQGSNVDNTPIINPNAFRYLEKPIFEKPHVPDDIPASALKPPKFIIPLQNNKVNEGSNVKLACRVEGYPFPTIAWFKDNKPLIASNRLITNYNLNSGVVSLIISDAQLGDNGSYTAFAQNKIGQDQTGCVLQVTETPGVDNTSMVKPDAFRYLEGPKESRRPDDRDRANYQPPKFIIPLSNIKIDEGQHAQFACKVEGYPKPKVTSFFHLFILKELT